MKIILGVLGAACAVLTAAVIVLALQAGGLHAQARQDQAAMHSLSHQVSALAGKATGTHRDLITCQDWQAMGSQVEGSDSAGGQISAFTDPPALPNHCINR